MPARRTLVIESTSTDLFYVIILAVLPYVTAVIFFGGLIYKILKWYKSEETGVKTVKSKQSSSIPTKIFNLIKGIILELIFLRRVYRGSFLLWIITWPMHIAILGTIFGHIRLAVELTPIWNLFQMTEEQIEAFSGLSGSIVGTIFLVGLVLLLIRRVAVKNVREISIYDDYVILLLLLGKAFLGMTMRWIPEAHVAMTSVIRPYFLNMLAFNPLPVPMNPYFALHFLIVMIFFMYLPFSKLIHIITTSISEISKELNS